MPSYWVRTTLSPPVKRRNSIGKIVAEFGGKLRENQIYSELESGKGYVLIKGPDDPIKAKAMLDRIGAEEVQVVLDLDEATQAYGLRRSPRKPATQPKSSDARRTKS